MFENSTVKGEGCHPHTREASGYAFHERLFLLLALFAQSHSWEGEVTEEVSIPSWPVRTRLGSLSGGIFGSLGGNFTDREEDQSAIKSSLSSTHSDAALLHLFNAGPSRNTENRAVLTSPQKITMAAHSWLKWAQSRWSGVNRDGN